MTFNIVCCHFRWNVISHCFSHTTRRFASRHCLLWIHSTSLSFWWPVPWQAAHACLLRHIIHTFYVETKYRVLQSQDNYSIRDKTRQDKTIYNWTINHFKCIVLCTRSSYSLCVAFWFRMQPQFLKDSRLYVQILFAEITSVQWKPISNRLRVFC